MPYITMEKRIAIDNTFSPIKMMDKIDCAGDLNYTITRICHAYVREHGEKYQTYNDLMGALEGAKLELYRRKIAPYEDKKIEENGDV